MEATFAGAFLHQISHVERARNKLSAPSYSLSPPGLTAAFVHSRWGEMLSLTNLGADVSKEAPPQLDQSKEIEMLHYSVVFLVIALIAAVFGFGGIAAGAVEIAKILFFIFAIMAIVSFVVSLLRKH